MMATEKRLVWTDDVMAFLCKRCNELYSDEPCEPSDCLMLEELEKCPTVDAAEVVHGRWDNGDCTVCGFDIRDLIDGESEFRNWVWEGIPYCPNCGADMRGDNK